MDGAELVQLDVASRRERRSFDDRFGLERVAQAGSTFNTRTVSGPRGAW